MAEGGKQGTFSQSLSRDSDALADICCDVCVGDDKHVEAEGYCVDCSDYLCDECFRVHKRSKLSRGHILQDKATMPRDKTSTGATASSSKKDECTEPCEQHPGRIAEYYCHDHKQLGCSVCMTVNHRKCDNVDHIPDLAQGLVESQAFKQVAKDVGDLKSRSSQVITKTKENIAISDKSSTNTIQKVLDLKKDVNQVFDTLLDDVKVKANAIKTEDQQKMAAVADTGQEVYKGAETIASDIDVLQRSGQLCQLYIKMLRMPDKLKMLSSRLEGAESENDITKMFFVPSTGIQSIIDGSISVGEICTDVPSVAKPQLNPKSITTEHVQNINVKTGSDSSNCWISGIAALPGSKLIIIDFNNNKVKLVDTKKSKITSEVKVPRRPWDVALLSSTSAAVTLPYSKQIMFIKIADTLKIDNSIDISGACTGIIAFDDKLVVSFMAPKNSVAIMDVNGRVERSIMVTDAKWLSHVAYEPVSQRSLVSDFAGGVEGPLTWIKSNDTSTVLSVAYKSSNLIGPRGLAIGPRDTLLAAGSRSENIILLSKEGTLIKVLVDKMGSYPCGISYCQDTDKLYVGFEEGRYADNVRIYQLS